MFSDFVKIKVVAGKGGNGIVSFRRGRSIAKGGPDGGDGGHGGNVILRSDSNLNNLGPIAHTKTYRAEDGAPGGHKDQHGKNGHDVIISVPVGTIVYEIDDQGKRIPVFDFKKNNVEHIIAFGGKGGFGNAHFTSSTRQAPRFSEYGLPGETKKLILELKSIADIGLIGLPNSGKSTFLSVVTQAKPKIADYPFTTLVPNLGVAKIGRQRIVIADIPGLIAGASQGKGLGHKFLKHVERTKILLHLIDINTVDPVADYQTIRRELREFSPKLARKREIICFTKLDSTGWPKDSSDLKDYLKKIKQAIKKKKIYSISSITGQGVQDLLKKLIEVAQTSRFDHPVIKTKPSSRSRPSKISQKNGDWLISGSDMERFAAGTDFTNPEAIQRLKDIIRKRGIAKTLEKQGLQSGDKIFIGQQYFIW